ncbi:chondroitinase family polysaccharide lyase [Prolixibacteraceae bacterium]|nr:chondroitinase family polysaccharide lyase [Prolixibacteraceae bacterium]
MKLKHCFVLLIAFIISMPLAAQKTKPIGFEDGLTHLTIKKRRGEIILSKEKSLRGENSLKWNWNANASLSFKRNIGYAPLSEGATNKHLDTFSFWIYNTQACTDSLRIEFCEKGKVKSFFYYQLNFTGWRTAWVSFDRDMQGTPTTKMNELKFIAPKSVKNGTFYIDEIITATPIDPRHQMGDHQVPFVNPNVIISANKHWMALEYFSQILMDHPIKAKKNVSTNETAGIVKIESRLNEMFLESVKPVKNISNWTQKLNKEYNLSNEKGKIVYFASYPAIYSAEKKPSKHLPFGTNLKSYTTNLLKVAQQYQLSNNSSDQEQLKKLFISMVKNMRLYGWVDGSGLGTLHHLGYNYRNYYPAMYLMREVLESEGLRDEITKDMMWFSGFGKIVEPTNRYVGINVDMLNTTLMGNLTACLMSKNENNKVANLNALKAWLVYGVDYVPGLLAPFKPDGSFFHHYNHYPLYAKDALDGATPIFYAISGTPFGLPKHNTAVVKGALLKMRLYSHNMTLPISMSGRHPYGDRKISPKPYYYMAKAGKGGQDSEIDGELASIYLSLAQHDKHESKAHKKEIKNLGFKAEINPQGNWSMNYASLNLHRQDDWLFSVKGFNAYLWGSEIYVKANAYGRYVSYGHYQLQRIVDGNEKTGFSMKGYDWNRYPGVTSIHLPIDTLAGSVIQVDHLSGYEELLISDEKFGAAISMDGQGIYAMKLHEHDKYHGSHRATKSYFMFKDYVLMLGSGIQNNVTGYPTETTIFQNSIDAGNTKVTINDNVVAQKGIIHNNQTLALIIDNMSNGWYIPKNGKEVDVAYQLQHSKDPRTKKPNKGTFYSAWINHGVAPKNASYEYALLIDTKPDALKSFASEQANMKHYVVAQKDGNAHIVVDRHSNTWGYAIFNQNLNTPFSGPILHCNIPLLAMVKESKNELDIELSNPDLNLFQGKDFDQYNEDGSRHEVSIYSRLWANTESTPVNITISIKGAYKVKKEPYLIHQLIVDGNTQVTIRVQHSISKHLHLIKM